MSFHNPSPIRNLPAWKTAPPPRSSRDQPSKGSTIFDIYKHFTYLFLKAGGPEEDAKNPSFNCSPQRDPLRLTLSVASLYPSTNQTTVSLSARRWTLGLPSPPVARTGPAVPLSNHPSASFLPSAGTGGRMTDRAAGRKPATRLCPAGCCWPAPPPPPDPFPI